MITVAKDWTSNPPRPHTLTLNQGGSSILPEPLIWAGFGDMGIGSGRAAAAAGLLFSCPP